jgi:putative spermidine/putrescine transport system ATP-binding protein
MSSLAAERHSNGGAGAPTTANSDDAAVRLLRASKRFGKIVALEDATLSIRRGELMTLLGPSGCGKTTLLNLVAGFLVPDTGEIAIDGRRVNDLPTYKREIGMMFQNYALFPHMTIADNVGYGLRMRGVAKPDLKRRVAEALSLVRLTGVEERRPHQLSGGQQQRVALARALVVSPKVLLLDEPFSALDRNLRASMQIEIKEIQRQLGVTTIFVTHDQSEALSLSDRIAVMFEGRIRQVGTPDEIYRRPADRFVASFVGDVNVLRGRLDRVDGKAIVTLGAARISVPREPLALVHSGDHVDLFIRPEQLRFANAGEPIAVEATVAAHIYQGGHVNLYLEAPEVCSSHILVRSLEPDAIERWRTGTRVGVSITSTDAIAFELEPAQPNAAPRSLKGKEEKSDAGS